MENSGVVLITGASSGIGKEVAVEAQAKGYSVVWCSRNIEAVASLVDQETSIALRLDVCSEESVKEVFQAVKERYGKLDVLVNCAGFVDPESMLTTSLENWNKTLSTNLTGTFLCCKYATSLMKNKGGKIINVSSTAALTPRPGWSAYAASKSGVISFSNAIAEELSSYNIRIFVICPGRTATPLRAILAPREDPHTIMQPDAVARIILYCMTEEAQVIEGQPIIVRDRF